MCRLESVPYSDQNGLLSFKIVAYNQLVVQYTSIHLSHLIIVLYFVSSSNDVFFSNDNKID